MMLCVISHGKMANRHTATICIAYHVGTPTPPAAWLAKSGVSGSCRIACRYLLLEFWRLAEGRNETWVPAESSNSSRATTFVLAAKGQIPGVSTRNGMSSLPDQLEGCEGMAMQLGSRGCKAGKQLGSTEEDAEQS